ncbi:integrase, partial [Leuconostoc mesenteroides subsp. cremoris]
STAHHDRHITEKQFYKVMARVGDLLGINYLVMHLLNHSSEAMTLTYLGLDQASRETMLDQIDFG